MYFEMATEYEMTHYDLYDKIEVRLQFILWAASEKYRLILKNRKFLQEIYLLFIKKILENVKINF